MGSRLFSAVLSIVMKEGRQAAGGGGVSILLVYLTVRGPAQSCREQAIDR